MKIKLFDIACARSGDKGINSNVGIIFKNKKIYNWAKKKITEDLVKIYFKSIVKGAVKRYELDNLLALNFILYDSLSGGGNKTLQNDAQGKTYGQAILMMKLDLPKSLSKYIDL